LDKRAGLHHSVNLAGLQTDSVYTQVRIPAVGYKTLTYTRQGQVGSPQPDSLMVQPATRYLIPGRPAVFGADFDK